MLHCNTESSLCMHSSWLLSSDSGTFCYFAERCTALERELQNVQRAERDRVATLENQLTGT